MPIPQVTRILVADDHALVRQGVKRVVDHEPDLAVVAEAADGAAAVEQALDPSIDLAILDISMPRKTGLQAAQELSRRRPELRTLILSMYENEQFLFEALPLRSPHSGPRLHRTSRRARTRLRPPHPPRARGTETDRRRPYLERDRGHARHQHQDRRPAPHEHAQEARHG
jgi:CheY-like chemotaxis protein